MIYTEQTIQTWSEFKNLALDLCIKNPEQWIFRGMQDSNWSLQTSLERLENSTSFLEFDDLMIDAFKAQAKHYLDSKFIPGEKDKIDWMTIMQHYGAPTRLLDWTRSPYVASFFAFSTSSVNNKYVSIWCINSSWLFSKNKELLGIPIHEELHTNELINIIDNNGGKRLVYQVYPRNYNQRVIAQQGKFLIAANPYYSFIDNFELYNHDELRCNFYKYNLDRVMYRDVMYELELMNISFSSLFPGLDGFAKSMMHYPISMNIQLDNQAAAQYENLKGQGKI